MSTVVRAEHIYTKKIYALKMINKRRINPSSLKRLLVERNILTRYRHPFIQTLKHSLQDACHVYFVTPFAQRGDLLSYVDEGPLAKNVAMFYLCEIVSGLRFLHANNIIHGDMKLENVLVNADGHIVLNDFGVSEQTKEGRVKLSGTMVYFAPEMFSVKLKTFASDMWALGVMMYEFFEKNIPWQRLNRYEMGEAIVVSNLPEALSFEDEDIKLVMSRLCAHDHEQRITATELIEMLVELGIVSCLDDVEQKKLVPPAMPAKIKEIRTTIPDFEIVRKSIGDEPLIGFVE